MHDPKHVVLSIIRPWPHKGKPRRETQRNPRRRDHALGFLRVRAREHACAHCDNGLVKDPPPSYHADRYHAGEPCPDCAGRGYNLSVPWRRIWFSWCFWRWGQKEWYFPPLLTVWHNDPEVGGSDSSCRDAYKPYYNAARADRNGLREWFWWKVMVHYDKWHIWHWSFQFHPWQAFARTFDRCEHCGERFSWGYAPISLGGWDGPGKKHFWQSTPSLYHHGACDYWGGRERSRKAMPRWLESWGHDETTVGLQAEQEPYQGDQQWWRVAILGEDPDTARRRAQKHPLYSLSYEQRVPILKSMSRRDRAPSV